MNALSTPRFLVALVAAVATLAAAPQALGVTKEVLIRKGGFAPASVTINSGDSVKWTNKDTIDHQVVADTGAFATPILKPNQSHTITLRTAGTFKYRDALEPVERGTVVVKGPPPSVTTAASLPIISFGTPITLSGIVSNGRAGERVEIFSRPYPQTSYVKLAEVLTLANGAWSYVTNPEILTSYQSHWNSRISAEVSVAVRPRISLGRKTGFFVASVTGGHSFAGRFIYLQRRTVFGQWVNVKKLRLGSDSLVRFKSLMPEGLSRLRVFMTVNQAGAGYLGGTSSVLLFRRR